MMGKLNVLSIVCIIIFFFSSRRRHTRLQGDWSSDVCSSDLGPSTTSRTGPCGRTSRSSTSSGDKNHGGLNQGDQDEPVRLSAHQCQGYHPEIGRASCRERV